MGNEASGAEKDKGGEEQESQRHKIEGWNVNKRERDSCNAGKREGRKGVE